MKFPQEGPFWKDVFRKKSFTTLESNQAIITNVRDFTYNKTGTETESWTTRSFDISNVVKVWFIKERFSDLEYVAHTFISFEFSDGTFLSCSIEARVPEGREYSLVKGMFGTFPVLYIWATENDAISKRAYTMDHEVFLYPLNLSPEDSRLLFKEYLRGTNSVYDKDISYNTLFQNCNNRALHHLNKSTSRHVPFKLGAFIPGYVDRLLLSHGYINTDTTDDDLEVIRSAHYISKKATEHRNKPDFSIAIRKNILTTSV